VSAGDGATGKSFALAKGRSTEAKANFLVLLNENEGLSESPAAGELAGSSLNFYVVLR